MARWCLHTDRALNDDERWNFGCTDEWGTHHQCKGCLHNRYMGDNNSNCLTNENYENVKLKNMSKCKLNKKEYLELIKGDIDFLKRNLPENLFRCIYTSHIIDVLKESVNLLYPENNNFIIKGKVFPATDEESRYKGMVYIISNLFNDVETGISNHSEVEMRVKVIDKKREII